MPTIASLMLFYFILKNKHAYTQKLSNKVQDFFSFFKSEKKNIQNFFLQKSVQSDPDLRYSNRIWNQMKSIESESDRQ